MRKIKRSNKDEDIHIFSFLAICFGIFVALLVCAQPKGAFLVVWESGTLATRKVQFHNPALVKDQNRGHDNEKRCVCRLFCPLNDQN